MTRPSAMASYTSPAARLFKDVPLIRVKMIADIGPASILVAQLFLVRILLEHGAPIGGATLGDALDSYSVRSDEQAFGQARWSYKVCEALLEHCHSMIQDERTEDVDVFLESFSKM